MFSLAKFLKRVENLQNRALRFLLNDYTSTYEDILAKADRSSMNGNRPRIFCVKIYETVINLNPDFEEELFALRNKEKRLQEINIIKMSSTPY